MKGYVAVLSRDSPLPDVTRLITACRKAYICLELHEDTNYFCIEIEEEIERFKVQENIRTVDRCNIASGVLRVGFISPNLDLVIYGDTEELEAFIYTVEAVKELTLSLPPRCLDSTHKERLSCICQGPNFKQRQCCFLDYDCPMYVSRELCVFCCYKLLESYSRDDACKLIQTWSLELVIDSQQSDGQIMNSVSVTSYPYLAELHAPDLGLLEIPEQLGSLPFLEYVDLSRNLLGQTTNWNWLSSPFLREHLETLILNYNELRVIPEPVVRLRNLTCLKLKRNLLTELPAALGNLKHLRTLDIRHNKLKILPGWMYRKEAFDTLLTANFLRSLPPTECRKPQLNPKDFETVSVPSLFETVVKHIITEWVAYWEYNMPCKLADLLEAAYLCRCGSVVLPNTGARVVQCQIKKTALIEDHYRDTYFNRQFYYDFDDDDEDNVVTIVLRLCSYKCYQLIEPFMI